LSLEILRKIFLGDSKAEVRASSWAGGTVWLFAYLSDFLLTFIQKQNRTWAHSFYVLF
jgi:hypothetical protein